MCSSLPAIISNPGKTFPHKIQCWAGRGVLQNFQKNLVITEQPQWRAVWQEAFSASGGTKMCTGRGGILQRKRVHGSDPQQEEGLQGQERDPGLGCLLGGHKKLLGIWHSWFFPAAGLYRVSLEQQGEDQTPGIPLIPSPMGLDPAQTQLRCFSIQHPGAKSESLNHRSPCSGGCLCFLTHTKEVRTCLILTWKSYTSWSL